MVPRRTDQCERLVKKFAIQRRADRCHDTKLQFKHFKENGVINTVKSRAEIEKKEREMNPESSAKIMSLQTLRTAVSVEWRQRKPDATTGRRELDST